MGNKLSHSSVTRFCMCNESYRLHYVERLRPIKTTSALVFGSALDNAINTLLITKDLEKAKENFEQQFKTNKINDIEVFIPTSTQISYKFADFDNDLLFESDVKAITEKITEIGLPTNTDYLSIFKEIRKNPNIYGENGIVFYNFCNWHSLFRKGVLMLTSYSKKVLPKLGQILAIQKEYTLPNGIGDSLGGFIDLIAEYQGKVVIFDNKSASMPYKNDSVLTSDQLSLYMHAVGDEYNTRYAGYIVLLKNIKKNKTKICTSCNFNGSKTSHTTCNNIIDGKRCGGKFNITMKPDVDVQIIVDKVPMKKEVSILELADNVNEKISSGQFEKCNIQQCENWFGQKCAFYGYCHNNGDMTGLIKKEKKDGK